MVFEFPETMVAVVISDSLELPLIKGKTMGFALGMMVEEPKTIS